MYDDVRVPGMFSALRQLQTAVLQPGGGRICDAADLHVAPDGKAAIFTGAYFDQLEGQALSRICRIDLQTGDLRMLTTGPNVDRLPRYAPDGRHIAFLSDRLSVGEAQLFILDEASGAAAAIPDVEGWVEYFHWSPDGKRILMGVAGRGADLAGGQGAMASRREDADRAAWAPEIETGAETYRWRTAWIYDLKDRSVRRISPEGLNIWEANWCGADAWTAVTSPGPSEGLWYSAALSWFSLANGEARTIFRPESQLGLPVGSPDGARLAFVQSWCSDRWIIAGDLFLVDPADGKARWIDTGGIDVSHLEWRSNDMLLIAGHRGFETAIAVVDCRSGRLGEVWSSTEITTGGRYVTVSGLGSAGDCAIIGENFTRAPELAIIRNGEYRALRSLDLGYNEQASAIAKVEQITWEAPDGERIDGWFVTPQGSGPFPVVMLLHGGPVAQWRPRWLSRTSQGLSTLALLQRGYAIFYPNPRGSTGRGQAFIRHVVGDMGGADAADCLSGIDYLVRRGCIDPQRIGITGGSYGGFMTCWLISQDDRFAAAVPFAPVSNHVSEHLISNIPDFVSLFLDDSFDNPAGKYVSRSPIMYARNVKTPTLVICGALDQCTPPAEAIQFHRAIREYGCESVLATYPQEGHGVLKYPAFLDFAARLVDWFETHMPAHGPAEHGEP